MFGRGCRTSALTPGSISSVPGAANHWSNCSVHAWYSSAGGVSIDRSSVAATGRAVRVGRRVFMGDLTPEG